jgi:carbamoyl-phosphate synthase small subunit
VVAYDYGVKRTFCVCWSTRLPPDGGAGADPAEEVLKLNPDGVFLSNGPGDPEPCDYAITAIKRLLETEIPIFGICLGHQLLAWQAVRKP